MHPRVLKTLRILAITVGATLLSVLTLAQSRSHPAHSRKTLLSEPTFSVVYNFTHPK